MKTASFWGAAFFGELGFFAAGFVSGRVTVPEPPPQVVYAGNAQTTKPERVIFTSKRGKQYYITPAGNLVYVKQTRTATELSQK